MNKVITSLSIIIILAGFSINSVAQNEDNACIGCHTSATKGIVNDWKESRQALKGMTWL